MKASPDSIQELQAPVEHLLEQLDVFMGGQIPEFEPEIRELVEYAFQYKGKRLRPLLVFYSGFLGGDRMVDGHLVKAAAILELIHLASLVHDDFLDEALMRRNHPTLAKKFGAKQAVLLGDALFAQALLLSAQFPDTMVCQEVSKSTRLVCSGEILQTLHCKGLDYSREDYFRVIDLKTAELFHISCFLGSYLSGNSAEVSRAFSGFGRHLGVAYQILDDWLDIVSSEDRLGKTLNTDLMTGKITLPMFYLLDSLPEEERVSIKGELLAGALDSDLLSTMFIENNIFECVRGAFGEQLEAAVDKISPYKGQSSVKYLMRIWELLDIKMRDAQMGV